MQPTTTPAVTPNSPTNAGGRNNTTAQTTYTVEEARQYLNNAIKSNASPKAKDHAYNRYLAKQLGIPAALIVKYLAFRIRKSKGVENGVQWHCQSVADITRQYPYLSASAVHAVLTKIPPTVLVHKRVKDRRTGALSTSYSIPNSKTFEVVAKDLIYFSADHAKEYGIHEAILLHKIQHWVRLRRRTQPDYRFHPMPQGDLATKLCISRASIARALNNLVAKGALEKKRKAGSKVPGYALSPALDPTAPTGVTAQNRN